MVALTVSDRILIMKVNLASSDFQDLADKFALLYLLCQEQLSEQINYNLRLRDILSVLLFSKEVLAQNQTMNETVLIDFVLMNMNLSKLVDDEEPLFLAFLSDVFGSKPNQKPDETVKNTLIANAISHSINPFPEWLIKTIQLQETCEVRYGIMIHGPSGSSKSSILNMLILAYSDTRCKHTFTRMNPKTITDIRYSRSIIKRLERWYLLSIVAYCKQHTTHGYVSMATLMQFRLKTLTQ